MAPATSFSGGLGPCLPDDEARAAEDDTLSHLPDRHCAEPLCRNS